MSDVEWVRQLARTALAALEASRQRIDDLNVYPVPDGDTGTNLTLTARAIVDALDGSQARERAAVAREVTRAALMGARGNSGVILSQIVRGAADVLARADTIDAATLATTLRGASDAAYRAVRRPVEGTMLTVIRELADEAEERASMGEPVSDIVLALVRRGEESVESTRELLQQLRDAGVVDAGGAGLLEIVRGVAAVVSGEPIPEPVAALERIGTDAIHQELSRFRYCTAFVVEGEALDARALEAELDGLGDSVLVVGDPTALKIHVHTDDPGAALRAGTAVGVIEAVEIANMHRQTEERQERLLSVVPDLPDEDIASGVVAVVAGAGNRRLFESLGAARTVDGGRSMNPPTADLVAAIEAVPAPEVLVLPNNPNVVLAAEQASELTAKRVVVLPSHSIPAGLAAMVLFDATRTADDNADEMRAVIERVATGAVTIASRDVEMNGVAVRKGGYLGLANGKPVAGGETFDDVACAVVGHLLSEPREVLTLLTGEVEPQLDGLLELIAAQHPSLELDVQPGGQPHYPLLLAAE